MILQDKQTKTFAIIIKYGEFNPWEVFSSKQKEPVCKISFVSSPKQYSKVLPNEVVSLAKKLDEALGSEKHDRDVQILRADAFYKLNNVALRPWALNSDSAYNSREEVDEGLKEWSKDNKSNKRTYDEIYKEYPKAQKALAKYYQRTRHLTPKQAEEVSEWMLDVLFRSFFIFSREGGRHYESPEKKSWPIAV